MYAERTEDGPYAALHGVGEDGFLVEGRIRTNRSGYAHVPAGADHASVDQLTAVEVSHVGVSLLTDPGAAVAASWIERGTDSFTVRLTARSLPSATS